MSVYGSSIWLSVREQRAPHEPGPLFAERLLLAAGIKQAAVDVFAFAQRLGIDLKPAHGARWSGAVKVDGDKATVWVRGADPIVRQRFTLAHELGHLLLHSPGTFFRDDTFSGSAQETEANDFAAALLMPRYLLVPHLRQPWEIRALARLFAVAPEAMTLRLHRLGIVSGSAIPPQLTGVIRAAALTVQ